MYNDGVSAREMPPRVGSAKRPFVSSEVGD